MKIFVVEFEGWGLFDPVCIGVATTKEKANTIVQQHLHMDFSHRGKDVKQYLSEYSVSEKEMDLLF